MLLLLYTKWLRKQGSSHHVVNLQDESKLRITFRHHEFAYPLKQVCAANPWLHQNAIAARRRRLAIGGRLIVVGSLIRVGHVLQVEEGAGDVFRHLGSVINLTREGITGLIIRSGHGLG